MSTAARGRARPFSNAARPDNLPAEWTPPGRLGAHLHGQQCTFRVWAPAASAVAVRLLDPDRTIALVPETRGYHVTTVDGVSAGERYMFVLDGDRELPDPASRHQPEGVHGASAVVDESFDWTDSGWRAPRLADLVIYELHIGTFTSAGTFDGVAADLPRLRDLGINAIEVLPVAQFPGGRNWGYDGVFPFAAQSTYGGPLAFKRMVDAAHRAGIAVILDVVYNHLGPEGNCLPAFGPFFTDHYRTPWGDALNFDGPESDEVRAYFIQCALQWVDEFHVDGLRFDAVHAIFDASAYPFLAELTDRLRERLLAQRRPSLLIAESDLADPRIISPTDRGGFGFDAQWLDDFHHAVHTVLTGESQGYYSDYGAVDHLRIVLQNAYAYAGQYSRYRRRRHGAPATDARPDQFIVCVQNHDQIGNRLAGDRLSTMISFDRLKLAAACTLLSPYVPMLYMGEEYGEAALFPYFVSHGDENLVAAVRKGRQAEFASFGWTAAPSDPQDEATFRSAVLDPTVATQGRHAALLSLHRDLIALRHEQALLHTFESLHVSQDGHVLELRRTGSGRELRLALNFGADAAATTFDGDDTMILSTDDTRYREDPATSEAAANGATANGAAGLTRTLIVPPFTAILVERSARG